MSRQNKSDAKAMVGLMLKRFTSWRLRSISKTKVTQPLVLAATLGCALACAVATSIKAHPADGLIIQTTAGPVQGVHADGLSEFLGIPYATPPVGNLRWMPPQPHANWTRVLQANAFGPTCAQITEFGVFAGPANANEDCLYLNVFAPDLKGDDRQKLPVIFWIHGGGLVDGESNDYDASKLAIQGHTVVVTINYRLNLFGFFAHPAIDNEGHLFGNYGLLDQQLALKWVNQNIERFGGDSHNVTIGGQSAGASSAAAHVISPLATGLFQRAIFESVGASYVTMPPLTISEAKGVNFAGAAGCGSGTGSDVAACLRKLTAQQILALSGTTSGNGPYINAFVLDGKIMPSGGITAFSSGKYNHVPIMNGTVEDEGNFNIGITEYFSGVPIATTNFQNTVQASYGGNAGPGGTPPAYPPGTVQAVLAQYPLTAYATPQLALDAVTTDPLACRARYATQVLAKAVPVYAYEFRDRTTPYYFPSMPGFQPLAAHTSDIQYLFPLFHGGPLGIVHQLDPQQERLSDELVAAWTNFAWAGNPNGHGEHPWPFYKGSGNAPAFLAENLPALTTFSDAQFSMEHKCDFWQQLLIYN